MAATLQATLHEIQIAPELYIQRAEEIIGRLPEPYLFEDMVYAHIASKKANELGHSLIVAGAGSDGIFVGAYVGSSCRQLGMPEEVVGQKKGYWAGSLGIRTNDKVLTRMAAAVDDSDHTWVAQFGFLSQPCADLLFRQYGLVKWLQVNYKERLDAREIEECREQVVHTNAAERRRARDARVQGIVRRYCPGSVIAAAQRMRDKMRRE